MRFERAKQMEIVHDRKLQTTDRLSLLSVPCVPNQLARTTPELPRFDAVTETLKISVVDDLSKPLPLTSGNLTL
ncbi:hypothetical protein NC652_009212 [Populus alba x Populus x berolinensis]|nr:hypothetical protein NC652_009212 [Populus alba x Populus x berolinensis]